MDPPQPVGNVDRNLTAALQTEVPSSTWPDVPSPAVPSEQQEEVAKPYETRSALYLANRILKTHHFANPPNQDVDAIPDATPRETPSCVGEERLAPVSELIGVSFPSSEICNALFEAYIDSVHWYLTVLDEDSLRTQLEPVFRTGLADPRQKPTVMLGLVVLVLGIHFASDTASFSHTLDMDHTEKALGNAAQKLYLSSMEQPTVESVAFSFLLSCYYLSTRQPRLSALTMNATMHAAQDIGLHQESTWGTIGFVERQIRRHIWWSVFTGAIYVALTTGKPSWVYAEACDVQLPKDLERDSIPSTHFNSMESERPTSLTSYVRYRTKIYIIASSVSRDMYLTWPSQPNMIIQRTKQIHERLLAWEKTVPHALKLDTYSGRSLDEPYDRRFAMQAMALQMAYDNIQLALFKPFVSESRPASSISPTTLPSPGRSITLADPSDAQPQGHSPDICAIAFQQCFISATRTSMIGNPGLLPILHSMQDSPINIHLGVHAFAAGVFLGLLAIQNPASSIGQECKRGIARLIKASKAAGLTAQVWAQTAGVLTELMRVAASEEVNTMLRECEARSTKERTVCVTPFGKPTEWYGSRMADESQDSGNPNDSLPERTIHTPSTQKTLDKDTAEESNGNTYESHCYVPSAASVDFAGFETGTLLDLLPFSEFTTENYTLCNYGQAWMTDDMNFTL